MPGLRDSRPTELYFSGRCSAVRGLRVCPRPGHLSASGQTAHEGVRDLAVPRTRAAVLTESDYGNSDLRLFPVQLGSRRAIAPGSVPHQSSSFQTGPPPPLVLCVPVLSGPPPTAPLGSLGLLFHRGRSCWFLLGVGKAGFVSLCQAGDSLVSLR